MAIRIINMQSRKYNTKVLDKKEGERYIMSITKKDENAWEQIEKHGVPCKINMQCDYKKTYTGAGYEYTPLGGVVNESAFMRIEELRRGKDNIL